MINKKIKIVFLFFLASVSIFSQNLSSKIDSVLQDSLFNVSQISINVYDLTIDKFLYQYNENLLFRPASNMKLLTTAAALIYLSPEDSFKTNFYYDGEIKDSSLNGNIYVKGGFDPLFKVDDFDEIISHMKQNGVKKIAGNLIADISNIDSLYFGKGWMWDDNPSGFMPYLSSLCINGNSVKIFYKPGKIGAKAEVKTEPKSKYYSFQNNLITTSEDTSDIEIERNWLDENNDIIIKGDISFTESLDSTSINVLNPPIYFLNLFSEKLQENKIDFNGQLLLGKLNEQNEVLFQIKQSLREVINETNKESDNLSAEMLVRKLSNENFLGTASAEKGLKYLDSLVILLDYDPETFVFADGSGLSHYNLINTSLITSLLIHFYKNEPNLFKYLYDSLPIAGVDGTLEKRMTSGNVYENVHAKTGTISGVSSLSGYLHSKDNHLLAFSIIIQNYSGSAKRPRKIIDEICKILSE